ncbi:MAG: hypothetical protein MUC34_12535 [Anaerolineae bacterium]|jgi:hypothetical protein|nr:hypothetical protein [Anaerolineae bacterium]
MSLLIAHHTWPLALSIFAAGALFVAALPRLYFRELARLDTADPPSEPLAAASSESSPIDSRLPQAAAPQQPTLPHAAH